MEQIKFKAWHTRQKRMYSCDELVADQMTLLADGRFINVSGDSTRLSQIDNNGIMIPILYTGFNDRNGVEVYNADILQVGTGVWFKEKLVVVWRDYRWGLVCLSNNEFYEDLNMCDPQGVEVIGNTYEGERQ